MKKEKKKNKFAISSLEIWLLVITAWMSGAAIAFKLWWFMFIFILVNMIIQINILFGGGKNDF